MRRKKSLIKITYSFLTILAGFAIIGGIYFSLRVSKVKAYQTFEDCSHLTATDNDPNNIPVECEGKDVTLIGGNFWNGHGTWFADMETVWRKDKTIIVNMPDGATNQNVKKGDGCDDSSDPDCDTTRHFKSLTLMGGAVLTHSAVVISDSDSDRQRRKVDLEIINTLTISDNSAINVDGKGYPGGRCLIDYNGKCLAKSYAGYGPGGGIGFFTDSVSQQKYHLAASGGSWAGRGGRGFCMGNPSQCEVEIFDPSERGYSEPVPAMPSSRDISSIADPVNSEDKYFEFGSGGGGSKAYHSLADGGVGGGRIRIQTLGKIVLGCYQNCITANGKDGYKGGSDQSDNDAASGGGSGGTIILDTPKIEDSGGKLISGVRRDSIAGGNSFGLSLPHFGGFGKIYAPEGFVAWDITGWTRITTQGGNGDGRHLVNNYPIYSGGGGGGLIVLKNIGSNGLWLPPKAKKVTSTVAWTDKTGGKETKLSTIVWGKPIWQVLTKNLEQKQVPLPLNFDKYYYTAQAYAWNGNGSRICIFNKDIFESSNQDEENKQKYCFYYRESKIGGGYYDEWGEENRNFDDTVTSDGKDIFVASSRTGILYRFNPKLEYQNFTIVGYINSTKQVWNEILKGWTWEPYLKMVRRPISVTTSKNSNDVYVLTADIQDNNYKIIRCGKTTGSCTPYTINIHDFDVNFNGVDWNVKMNIAFAENAVDFDGRLILTAYDIGSLQNKPLFIARLKLNNNGTVSVDDGKIVKGPNGYKGGTGIYIQSYGTAGGFATVGSGYNCYWSGFNLDVNPTCEGNNVYGKDLNITRDLDEERNRTLVTVIDSSMDNLKSLLYGYPSVQGGGGSAVYFNSGINF